MSYLEGNREGIDRLGLPTNLESMSRLVDRYQWFTMARVIVSVESDRSDPRLEIYLMTHPRPTPMLKGVAMSESDERSKATVKKESSMQLIDAFLSAEHHNSRPNDATPEHNVAEESAMIEIDEDIATEELAQIYMAQGLTEQAEEIFRKLKKH